MCHATSVLVNHGSTLVGFKGMFYPINRVQRLFVKEKKNCGLY